MKVTLFKKSGSKEVINRMELQEIAAIIKENRIRDAVWNVRSVYQFMRPERLEDGQIDAHFKPNITLPRICFSAEYDHFRGERRMQAYNGLVVIEVNNLNNYEKAIAIREQAKKMPETMMVFIGGSGMSVKIVCRGELYEKEAEKRGCKLPEKDDEIRRFHLNIYHTARKAYQNQFGFDIEYLDPRLDRTIYLSADPEMSFNPQARPFYADAEEHTGPEPVTVTDEEDNLMPGRTVHRSYHFNYLFVVENVLGRCIDLPDEEYLEQLLMIVATRCLQEGIPLAHAKGMTLLHPVLNPDRLLVEKTFSTVYAVALQKDYAKKHKIKSLKSVPEDTIQAMKTEIFLNTNYDMRKNLLTGVAEYREKFSEDQTFSPLTEEVRNDMTLRATELGLKSWDRDVNRFIDSTRIEQYDPVNAWLDKLPSWNGHDYIAELAARVPTSQPHWEMYLKKWIVGMIAQWRESDKQLTGNALTPLLIGRQGCGKTRFCKIILPPELRDYYNDKLNFKNEFDLNMALASFALINIDEFDKTTNSQQIVLKYLLSSADVKYRPPYGKTIKQYRRYTSFIGTTNQQKPLVDPTGSRRFVCVGVNGNINFEDNLNYQQLYAQALYLFNNGERYWLDDDEINTLIAENEPFQKINDLVEMIAETFRKPQDNENVKGLSLEDIRSILAQRFANFDPKTSFIKLGLALSNQQFGFESKRNSKMTLYHIVER